MRSTLVLLSFMAALASAPAAHAECYADYKAKRDDPLRLHYGVAEMAEKFCDKPKAARGELQARLDSDGWTLIKILGFFGPEGLAERKQSAGDYFLRY